jgi:ABC-type Fe3+/spermidine/putrescine transport system ATPase subunit
MSELRLQNLTIRYGKVTALDGLDLVIRDGELVTLLGPSGCGKTTTLRSVSGFLTPADGDIFIGDRRVTDIPPERRGIGLVFQNYALWPHMTVNQNLAFGLQMRKLSAAVIAEKVRTVLGVIKLEGFGDRYPRQLSGGQQQRVALARAIVLEPDILLLDEPLSNLDALLREQMRFEIAQIHKRLGITTMYVTHDQTEAMVISDRIVVLNNGRIMQEGSPQEIYLRPANKFVAGFMGTTTFVSGTVASVQGERCIIRTADGLELAGSGRGFAVGRRVSAAVRPESIELLPAAAGPAAVNCFEAVIDYAFFTGELVDYQLRLGSIFLRARGNASRPRQAEERVSIRIDPERLPIVPDSDAA